MQRVCVKPQVFSPSAVVFIIVSIRILAASEVEATEARAWKTHSELDFSHVTSEANTAPIFSTQCLPYCSCQLLE